MRKLLAVLFCALMILTAAAEELPARLDLSDAEELSTPAAEVEEIFTPGKGHCGKPGCFWETPMDYTNEAAVWAMLTAPMIVVDGNFRAQANIYAEPSEDSKPVGEVTRSTQGVHVLETLDNGWTKIETYSSSFAGSRIKAYNQLVTGYIQTEQLVEVPARTEYGLVVDKLTQRLYIYHEGKLFDTLAVSTGLGTKADPENETRSGEYLLYSATGGFWSNEFLCNFGIRYNDGDLLHEVPHIPREEGAYYGRTEPKLGQRASHGCIRVQRKRTENGVNMRWIWDNLRDKMKTRMVIWEDWAGRTIPLPGEDTALYYNPKSGRDYHDSPTCYGVNNRYEPMTAFSYGELENEGFAKLKACQYCIPPRRAAEIEKINAAHAPAIPEEE